MNRTDYEASTYAGCAARAVHASSDTRPALSERSYLAALFPLVQPNSPCGR